MTRGESSMRPGGFSIVGFVLVALLLLTTCVGVRADRRQGVSASLGDDYRTLLLLHPMEAQGKGPDPGFEGEKHQSEAYGLLLAAEARRYAAQPTRRGRERVRRALRWLIAHPDLDGDGLVGWGLPDAWDAFSDGSENPPHHPYTISMALIAEGLLDALEADRKHRELLGSRTVRVTKQLLRSGWRRWATQVWTATPEGGYFWYSPAPADDYFVPNVSAMWAGVGARLTHEPWVQQRRRLLSGIKARTQAAAASIIASVDLRRDLPYWNYVEGSHDLNRDDPNDLVHHVYILWGMERARDAGLAEIPWTREQAMDTVPAFFRDGRLWAYPQDEVYREDQTFSDDPPRLWCVGAALALLGEFGGPSATEDDLVRVLREDFGPLSGPTMYPVYAHTDPAYDDPRYFPRFGTHVLWGLSTLLWPPA